MSNYLMETGRMYGLNVRILQAQANNHVIWRRRRRTPTIRDQLLHYAQAKYNATAARDIIEAIGRQQLIAVSFAQVNVRSRIEMLQVCEQCRHTSIYAKTQTSAFECKTANIVFLQKRKQTLPDQSVVVA